MFFLLVHKEAVLGSWVYFGVEVLGKLSRSKNEPSTVARDDTGTTSDLHIPSSVLQDSWAILCC